MKTNNQSPEEIAREVAKLRSIPLEKSVKKKFYDETFDAIFPLLKNGTISLAEGRWFADMVLELENIDNYGDFLAFQAALGITKWEFLIPILERYAEQTNEILKLEHGFSSDVLLHAALSPTMFSLNHKFIDKFNNYFPSTQETDTVYCTQCGAQNHDSAHFCFKCGVPLEQRTN